MTRRINITSPAAGADLSYTKPLGKIWTVLGVDLTYQTSATVGNRTMNVTLDIQSYAAGSNQPASKTWTYFLRPFVSAKPSDDTTNGYIFVAIGEGNNILVAAENIVTAITNIKAGDQLSAITLIVNEK